MTPNASSRMRAVNIQAVDPEKHLAHLVPPSAAPTVQVIRIAVADAHALDRDGLRMLLSSQPDFRVVGEVPDGLSALSVVRELQPDVLLLDVGVPKMTAFEVLQELRTTKAAVRTILLAASIDRGSMLNAIQLGGRGIVLRDTLSDLLYKCIRRVHEGEVWISHAAIADLAAAVAGEHPPSPLEPPEPPRDFGLTARELDVLRLIVEGETNKGIAARLAVGPDTVKHHLTNIFNKLGASNRLELALFALHHRLVSGS